MKVQKVGKREVLTGKAELQAPRRFWAIKPFSKAHSSQKGKRGYKRNDNKWKKDDL